MPPEDISKKLEKLVAELKLYAKDIEIGSKTMDKESIKILEEKVKKLREERDEREKNGSLIGDELDKTKKILDENEKLLSILKKSTTLTGQFELNFSSTADYLRNLVTDFKEQFSIAQNVARVYKQLGRNIGETGENAKIMEKTFKDVLPSFTRMGLDSNDLQNSIESITELTGRRFNLNEKDLKNIGAMAEGVGLSVQKSAEMAESFMLMGLQTDKIEENIFETYKSSQKMGLNASKVIDVLSNNIRSMQTYSFVNGVKGMTEMAKQAVKMRMDVSDVLSMADKFYQPEAAIEAAAELQLLGGEIADAFGDPFTIMYEARNKPEELAKRIQDMTENMLQLNKKTGEYELPAEARMQFQSLGKTLGLNVDKMIEMSRQTAKIRDFKMKFTQVGDEDMKESLATMAKMGKDGKMVVEYKDEAGEKKQAKLEDVTEEMAKSILNGNQTQEESLYDIAVNTKVSADYFKNLKEASAQKISLTSNIYEVTAEEIKDTMLVPLENGIETLLKTVTEVGESKAREYMKDIDPNSTTLKDALTNLDDFSTMLKDKTLEELENFNKKLKETTDTISIGSGNTNVRPGGSTNDGILTSSGELFSFNSKDDFFAAKPGGVFQQVLQENYMKETSEKIVKVDFGKLDLNISSDNPNMNFTPEQKNQLIGMITERIGKSLYNEDISGGNTTDGFKSRFVYNS